MGASTHHHLVPAGLLRTWAVDSQRKLVRVELLPSGERRAVGVSSVSVRPHWNSFEPDQGAARDTSFETATARFESEAVPALRRLESDGKVYGPDRLAAADAIANLGSRTLLPRERMAVETTRYIDEAQAAGLASPAVVEQLRFEYEHGASRFNAQISTHEALRHLVASMQWTVFHDPRGGFMTADHPLLFWDGVDGRARAFFYDGASVASIWLPLSPTRVLRASMIDGPDEGPQTAPIALPAWLNCGLRAGARHHLVLPPHVEPRELPPEGMVAAARRLHGLFSRTRAQRAVEHLEHSSEQAVGETSFSLWEQGGLRRKSTARRPARTDRRDRRRRRS